MTSVIPWLLQTHSNSVILRATQVVRTQTMATWDMWYIDKGFLVWIISLTCQSRESIIWACTTSFIHTFICCIFNIFIACLCVPILSIPFFMHVFRFRFIDIHVFTRSQIYCHFLYATCHCLYLYAWATSLDHVHVWLFEHANWLYHMYSRVASDNPEFSYPDPGIWTVAALLFLIRVA